MNKARYNVLMSDSQVKQFKHIVAAEFMGAIDIASSYASDNNYRRYELYRIKNTNTVGARYGDDPSSYISAGAGVFTDMGLQSISDINTPTAVATRALVLMYMEPRFYPTYQDAVNAAIL